MFQGLVARLQKLITDPKQYWADSVDEPGDIKSQLFPTMALLAGVSAVAGFLGQLFLLMRFSLVAGLLAGVFTAVMGFAIQIGIWIGLGFIIDALATSFGAQRNIGQSMKLASGTIIPMWLGSILNLIPFAYLGMLGWLAGLGYGAYVLYLGLPIMNGTAPEKAVGYTGAAIGILLVVSLIAVFLVACPAGCLVATALTRHALP